MRYISLMFIFSGAFILGSALDGLVHFFAMMLLMVGGMISGYYFQKGRLK